MELHSFIIPIASLQEKVEKHTSVLGKHRSGEGSPHLLDRYSLTEGEGFLFDDYLKEAVVKTYHWMKAFGRNLKDGYRIYGDGSLVQVRADNGIGITVNGYAESIPTAVIPISSWMYTTTLNAAESAANEDKTYDVVISLPIIKILIGTVSQITYAAKIKYRTLAGGAFDENCEYNMADVDITSDTTLSSTLSFRIHVDQTGFDTVLDRIDCMEITLKDIVLPTLDTYTKGTFIEHIAIDGSCFGEQSADGTIQVERWYEQNIRKCVVMNVELPDWQDRNMIPAAQELIEEALINYILFRWFESVQDESATTRGGNWRKPVSLADIHYQKWEEKAHEVQMALNSERKILQRKSTWL